LPRNLKKTSSDLGALHFNHQKSNRIHLGWRKAVRRWGSAEKSRDIAVGEPEPGEIKVNGV
jgi:hypothetical protein